MSKFCPPKSSESNLSSRKKPTSEVSFDKLNRSLDWQRVFPFHLGARARSNFRGENQILISHLALTASAPQDKIGILQLLFLERTSQLAEKRAHRILVADLR